MGGSRDTISRAMASKVLIVDDDVEFRGLAARVLAAMGLQVVGEAGTFADGAAAAAELRPDAALVDVGLPDGDGIALAEHSSRCRGAPAWWSPRRIRTPPAREAVQRFGAVGFMRQGGPAGRDAGGNAPGGIAFDPWLRRCASWSARTTSSCARAWCGC